MSPLAQVLCVLCASAAGVPSPQTSRQAGDIRYTHEVLGGRQHLLRLSTEYFFVHTDRDRTTRMSAFAEDFARHTCRHRFRFVDRRGAAQRVRPVLSRDFVFRCT
jgi:hypothetical protein